MTGIHPRVISLNGVKKEYGIRIDDWEAEKCNTIGDMVELIKSKTNA